MNHQGHGRVSQRLTRRLLPALVALTALAVGVFLLIAVSGSSAPASSGGGSKANSGRAGSDSDRAAFRQFRECLRENGVKPKRRSSRRGSGRSNGQRSKRSRRRGSNRSGRSQADREKFEQALEKCAEYLPAEARERYEQQKKFRECLKENGVEPKGNKGKRSKRSRRRGSNRSGRSQADREKFEQALEKCAEHLPEEARQRMEQHEKFRECMKENGVELKPRGQGRHGGRGPSGQDGGGQLGPGGPGFSDRGGRGPSGRGGGARRGRNQSGRRGGRRGDRGRSGRRNRSGRSQADREKFQQALEKCEQYKPERPST